MNFRNKIRALEKGSGLNLLTIGEKDKRIQVYPWVKARLFHKFLVGKEVMNKPTTSVLVLQLKTLFMGFRHWFSYYPTWVFSKSIDRVQIEGKSIDRIFNCFQEGRSDVLTIEFQLHKSFAANEISRQNRVSKSWLLLMEQLLSLFMRASDPDNSDLLAKAKEKLGVDVDVLQVIKKYKAQYRVMKFLLFFKKAPKRVFLTVSYTHFGYIRALKERGVRVIEMQHGVIGASHQAYHYDVELDSVQFPDVLAVTGQSDKASLEGSLFPVKEIVPCGNAVLDHYKKKSSGDELNKVLVTLQPGDRGNQLLPFIVGLAKACPNKSFLLKARNQKEVQAYKKNYDFPSNISFSKGESFYDLLMICGIHCTYYSTTAVEALAVGVPNLIIDIDGYASSVLSHLGSNPHTKFEKTIDAAKKALFDLSNLDPEVIRQSANDLVYADHSAAVERLLKTE